jgi:hypothetical protein
MSSFEQEAIAYLRSPKAIRDRSQQLFHLACEDKLRHFRIDLTQLDKCADYVVQVTRDNYPDLNIPFHSRWRHFEVGVSRLAELSHDLAAFPPLEKARIKFDLVIVSVLLDAGAGADWYYYEAETGQTFQRSEGLAVASFRMFRQGLFSSNKSQPLQADAKKLQNLTATTLAEAFQINEENMLLGLEGRLELLQRLGKVLTQHPEFFGTKNPRPGNLVNYLLNNPHSDSSTQNLLLSTQDSGLKILKATDILRATLEGFGEIWPGREVIATTNLGDVWRHPALPGENPVDQYVPFHKLSQWLTYSLLEPLQELGIEITELDEMTGLPEYRNGGLCLDIGLLQAKHLAIYHQRHLPGSEIIVEWRSLTVTLLDKIADTIRQKLGMNQAELPLVKVLQGGTWSAGRRIAAELRTGGVPPIEIESDGTVF